MVFNINLSDIVYFHKQQQLSVMSVHNVMYLKFEPNYFATKNMTVKRLRSKRRAKLELKQFERSKVKIKSNSILTKATNSIQPYSSKQSSTETHIATISSAITVKRNTSNINIKAKKQSIEKMNENNANNNKIITRGIKYCNGYYYALQMGLKQSKKYNIPTKTRPKTVGYRSNKIKQSKQRKKSIKKRMSDLGKLSAISRRNKSKTKSKTVINDQNSVVKNEEISNVKNCIDTINNDCDNGNVSDMSNEEII